MRIKDLFEVAGRMVIVALIAFAVNRTQWYQSLPLQTLTNTSGYVWLFSFGIVLSLIWVINPLLKIRRGYT